MSPTLGPPGAGVPAQLRGPRADAVAASATLTPGGAITNTRRNSESLHNPDLPQGQVLDAASLEAGPREAVTRHPNPPTRRLARSSRQPR
jgi:hypothetical protein